MLKIKDNINLKELEKYGFKPNALDDNYAGYYKINENADNMTFINDYSFGKNKTIALMIEDGRYYITDTLDDLYDLIKADLIEKVD